MPVVAVPVPVGGAVPVPRVVAVAMVPPPVLPPVPTRMGEVPPAVRARALLVPVPGVVTLFPVPVVVVPTVVGRAVSEDPMVRRLATRLAHSHLRLTSPRRG